VETFMPTSSEPRNPLYILLLAAGVLFVVTAFAYAIVPVLEQKALDAGQAPPPSPFRGALRAYGGIALLGEVAVVVVLSIASMVWDRLRTLQKERAQGTIPPTKVEEKSP
jgi:amino acid transporter